jgi:excisionase family DNA binding protein
MEQQLSGDSNTDMLTVREVCAKLKISRWMVNELRRSGRLASVKIGSRRLFPLHSLQAYERELEEEGGIYDG